MSSELTNPNKAQKKAEYKSGVLMPPPFEAISETIGTKPVSVNLLAGDGSDRCYYRIICKETGESHVLMQLSGADATALKADNYDWLKIGAIFEREGIFYPKLQYKMSCYGAIIIEDYGDIMLETKIFDLFKNGAYRDIEELYKKLFYMICAFLRIQSSPSEVWCKRSFDQERYIWELNFFRTKYLENEAGIILSEPQKKEFDMDVEKISSYISEFSRYFVHRDFHSRNIMLKDKKLAVIDFQDARLGGAAYDLLSLCFDSYVPFSPEMRMELFYRGQEIIKEELGSQVLLEIEAHWKPMLLQRQLKAIGSFAFLTSDKCRGNYLKYVEPAFLAMERVNVFNKEWPFLSGDLPKIVKEAIKKKC